MEKSVGQERVSTPQESSDEEDQEGQGTCIGGATSAASGACVEALGIRIAGRLVGLTVTVVVQVVSADLDVREPGLRRADRREGVR